MQKVKRALKRVFAWLIAVAVYLASVVIGYGILSGAIWPEATGAFVQTQGGLTIDASNAALGYVMAKGAAGNEYKMRVSKDGAQLMYDLDASGEYQSFPLQLGSGKYSFELFRQVKGNKYAQEGSISLPVELNTEYAAFLLPNQYVDYDQNTEAVQVSDEICSGLETDAEKLQAVRDYIVSNYTYDFDKAKTITAGVLPSIDYLFEKKMGICQDIAATAACMLRVQGIPTQLVIGYANKYYHAWNNVLIDGEYQLVDLTAEINSAYQGVTYTVERYY